MKYYLTFYGFDDTLLGIVEIIKKAASKSEFVEVEDEDEFPYQGPNYLKINNKDVKLIWILKKTKELEDIVLSNILPVHEVEEVLDSHELISEIFTQQGV